MKKFTVKAILFYAISAVCALTITGLTNVAIYWFLAVAGLSDLGSMPLFIAGLALVETAVSVYCVSQISEDMLYYDGEYDEEETANVFEEEKAT